MTIDRRYYRKMTAQRT